MNNTTPSSGSRWLVRLSAPLAGLALLGAGIGAAQAHDFNHHDRSTVNVHRHLPIHREHNRHRDHDRRNYGHDRRDHHNRYGWRDEHRAHGRHDYRDHRYTRDRWHDHDRNRGLFGRR